MRQAELEQAMKYYLAKGGRVTEVQPNVRAIDDGLRHCRCGCRGNYTDHTMRLGERGIR